MITTIALITGAIAWLLIGFFGFKRGWKKMFIEFKKEDVWKACAVSWLGLLIFPLMALMAWGIDRK